MREVLAGLGFGQANGADFRLGEHRSRDQGVVGFHILAAEDSVGKGLAFADGDRRQVHAVGDIAHGIDIVGRGARIGIDLHGVMRRQINAGIFEAKVHDIGQAPGGKHHMAGAKDRAILQRYANPIAAASRFLRHRSGCGFQCPSSAFRR